MKDDYKKGRTVVDGRTFQIEFWNESGLKLPWVRVSEILQKESKIHWRGRKKEIREVAHYIDEGWTTKNRLEWAQARIRKYLQQEYDDMEELKQIEDFCKTE